MSEKQKNPPSTEVQKIQDRLRRSFAAGNEERACLDLAELGQAFFRDRKEQKGLDAFAEALEIAQRLGRVDLQASVLGRKALTLQDSQKLVEAYQVTAQILALSEASRDPGMKCDVLAHQAQIQLAYGDQSAAQSRLMEARQLALDADDQHRLMNITGLLGRCSQEMENLPQAETYFVNALELARGGDDLLAETRLLDSLGSLRLLMGQTDLAKAHFHKILANVEEEEDYTARSSALFHLTQIYTRAEDYTQVQSLARQGLSINKQRDPELALFFISELIRAGFFLNQLEEVLEYARTGLEMAHEQKSEAQIVELWTSAGEASLVLGRNEHALAAYSNAMQGAQKLALHKESAHLAGRIGYVLAEMGSLEQSLLYHQQSCILARQENLPGLEGEQLSLLALNSLELGKTEQAESYCRSAIQVYEQAGMEQQAEKARRLLEQILV